MHSSCSLGSPMTDTNTLACCKSPETSARVTVTPVVLTRGSRSSNRIVSLATSRTASATRASRWAFMSHFHLAVDELGHRVPPQRLGDLLQGAAHVSGLGPDHRHAQDRHLPLLLRLDLRHG